MRFSVTYCYQSRKRGNMAPNLDDLTASQRKVVEKAILHPNDDQAAATAAERDVPTYKGILMDACDELGLQAPTHEARIQLLCGTFSQGKTEVRESSRVPA